MIKTDRYGMLCIAVSLVLFANIVLFDGDVESNEKIGVINDIKKTQNGFSFTFEDSEGSIIKCFYDDEPIDNGIYAIEGRMSENEKILFLSSMTLLSE